MRLAAHHGPSSRQHICLAARRNHLTLTRTRPLSTSIARHASRSQQPTPPSPSPSGVVRTSRSALNSNPRAPRSHDRGPHSEEDTQTDFSAMDILTSAGVATPATSIDACTHDGFYLNNGIQTHGGMGVLLLDGEAFVWTPWDTSSATASIASSTGAGGGGFGSLLDRRGLLTIQPKSLGILGLIYPKPDLLLIGTGRKLWMLNKDTRRYLSEELGMKVDVMDTPNAAAAYNLLVMERESQDELTQARQQVKSSRQEGEEVQEQLGTMEHDTTNLQDQSMASQKSNLELLLQTSQEKEKSLQEQLEVGRKDQQGQQNTLQRQLQESQGLIAGVRAGSSGRLEELKSLRPELTEAQEQLTTVRQELKLTKDTLSSCKDEIQRIQTKLHECYQIRDDIKQQSADNRHHYESTLKVLTLAREKAAELGAKNQNLEKGFQEATSDCNEASINVMALKLKLKISENQTERSNQRNETLVTESNAAQTDLSNWQKVFLCGYQPSAVVRITYVKHQELGT
ncbi:hypothetical protein LTR92_002046 [Exophiala xenobiotica]|nr:hypothetical protein LTR92_002046 [Exophiala xenobiotica]KAK5451149.1 hypothetical protein LTR18_001165 [Exophiala xenobiotica]